MKKSFILLALTALVATSCATGMYLPNNVNVFGAQTTVVLDKANFKVVRDVEAVVEVNNSNLKRTDVEKSAYAELLRNARLKGSQVLTNVVVEQVRRESGLFFTRYKQYVSARGTIIEFLPDDVLPVQTAPIATSVAKEPEPVKTSVSGTAPSINPTPAPPTVPKKDRVVMTATPDESFNPLDYSISDADNLITQIHDDCVSKNTMLANGAQYYVNTIYMIESIYKAHNKKIRSYVFPSVKSRVENVFEIIIK